MVTEDPGIAATSAPDPPVVTIVEQYGAGADEVGARVADALGLPHHAQASAPEELERGDALEQDAVLATVHAAMGGAYGGFEGRDVVTTQQQKFELVAANNRAVWELAARGGVIVGRNGAVVLAGRPRTVHVLLTGSVEDRVARAARASGIPVQQAARRQVHEDDVRVQLSLVLYGWDVRLPDRYDLVVDTSRLPPDAAAAVVVQAVRAMAT